MSCAQVQGMTTAGLVAMRSSCPRNPPGSQPVKPRKQADDGYGAEVLKPGPHDVLLGRGGGTNNHCGNINFRKLVNEHKMRYLACSKIEKPTVAREVVELWRKMSPPGRFLARKEDAEKDSKDGEDDAIGSGQVIWVEVPEKKAREKASQCLRERTQDVLPYIQQIREHQDRMTQQGVSMVQQQLKMQREGEGQQLSLRGMAAAAANHSHRSSQPEQHLYQNPMAAASMVSDFGNRRGSMPMASIPSMGMGMAMHDPRNNFNRRLSAPHLSSGHNSDANAGAMMGHPQYGMTEPGFVGSCGDMYDPAYASTMTAMQLQHQHQQMQLQHLKLRQQQLQMQMHYQQMQVQMQAAQLNMRMVGSECESWNIQPVNMPSSASGMLPEHAGHGQMNTLSLSASSDLTDHNVMMLNDRLRDNRQGSRPPEILPAVAELEPLPLPDKNASDSAASLPAGAENLSPPMCTKTVMKALSSHDRAPKPPKRQPKKATKVQPEKAAMSKVPGPPASGILMTSPEPTNRTVANSAPAVSPEDEDLLTMPLAPDAAHEDELGELTKEKYRETLISYMASNNIQAQHPNYYSDEDDLSIDSFPVWPDEADRREIRPEIDDRMTKQSRAARAPPKTRNVERHKSGQSMMSCKTFKSNTTSLSGLSMLSDMMSMESAPDDKMMRESRRFSSNASIMSDLTDISHTIDGLGLDDDC